MSSCPFCQGEIADDLERFGGPCPHCFNEIPGEEAATDPGVAAQAAEKQAQQLQAKKRGVRTVLLGGAALLLLAGGGGWFGYQEHLKQQQIAALASENYVLQKVSGIQRVWGRFESYKGLT